MYIMSHRDEPINIEDRDTLHAIEERLKAPPTEAELDVVKTKKEGRNESEHC